MLTEPGGKIPVICGEKGLHGDYVVLIIYSDKEHSGEMLSSFPRVRAPERGGRAAGASHGGFVPPVQQKLGSNPQPPCQHTALMFQLLPCMHLFSHSFLSVASSYLLNK